MRDTNFGKAFYDAEEEYSVEFLDRQRAERHHPSNNNASINLGTSQQEKRWRRKEWHERAMPCLSFLLLHSHQSHLITESIGILFASTLLFTRCVRASNREEDSCHS